MSITTNNKESEKRGILSKIGVDIWLLRKNAILDDQVDEARDVGLAKEKTSATALVIGNLAILVRDFSTDNKHLIKDLFGSIVGYGNLLDSYEEMEFFWSGNGAPGSDALQSFLRKIFINCDSPVLLAESSLLEFPSMTENEYSVEEIPTLADLSNNPDLKRELWQRIQKL